MSSQQYSRLSPHNHISEIPLSRISSIESSSKPECSRPTPEVSDDTALRPRRSQAFPNRLKDWWVEIAGLALAIGILLCTAILLAHFRGKPIEQTPQNPSLNTLVNIFSTIEAGLIVYVAAEILAQAKWHRFHSEASLVDFELIDDASRGATGSARVLLNPRLGWMAFIGSTTTLLAILIGPMLQQTLAFESKSFPEFATNTTAPISKFYAPPSNKMALRMDQGLQGTMINGLSQSNTSSSTPSFDCATGNCTYDTPYISLAVCHTCEKLQPSKTCNDLQPVGNCNYTLPNGHQLWQYPQGLGDFSTINVSSSYNSSTVMDRVFSPSLLRQFALGRYSVISLTNGPLCDTNGSNLECTLTVPRNNETLTHLTDGGVIGAYCDLALCTNTYTAQIKNSVLNETILSSTDSRNLSARSYFVLGDEHYDPTIIPEDCYIDGHPFTREQIQDTQNTSWIYVEVYQTDSESNLLTPPTIKVPIDCVFTIQRIAYESIHQFSTNNPFYLDGYGSSNADTGVAGGLFTFLPSGDDISQGLFGLNLGVQSLFNNGDASFATIDASFEKLATSMTAYIRQNSGQKFGNKFPAVEGQLAAIEPVASGLLLRSHTIIVVKWYWIILPCVILVVMCGYLIVAIAQGGVEDKNGSKADLWKSNALAPLAIGHTSNIIDISKALSDHDAMRALKRRRATLVEGRNGWAFIDMGYRDRL